PTALALSRASTTMRLRSARILVARNVEQTRRREITSEKLEPRLLLPGLNWSGRIVHDQVVAIDHAAVHLERGFGAEIFVRASVPQSPGCETAALITEFYR